VEGLHRYGHQRRAIIIIFHNSINQDIMYLLFVLKTFMLITQQLFCQAKQYFSRKQGFSGVG